MKQVPLRNRSGEIVAVTLVDDEDFERVLAAGPWHRNSDGYAVHNEVIEGRVRTKGLHRFILGLDYGNPLIADHVNRDRLDNRRANLRAVTKSENGQNVSVRGGTSAFRGVHLQLPHNRWRAQVGGKYLGLYATEAEAAEVAARWRQEHWKVGSDQ